MFFDLCDVDGSGMITRKELYDVLKRNCITEDERAKLKKTCKKTVRMSCSKVILFSDEHF